MKFLGKLLGRRNPPKKKYPDEEQYKYRYDRQNVLCSYSPLSTSVKTLIFTSLLVKILLIIKEKQTKLSQQKHLHYSHVFPKSIK